MGFYNFEEIYFQQEKRTTKMRINQENVDNIKRVKLKRVFAQPTYEEIKERKKMYKEADLLGIDLMGYDEADCSPAERRDRRKAVVLLGMGKKAPKELKERLIKRKTDKTK